MGGHTSCSKSVNAQAKAIGSQGGEVPVTNLKGFVTLPPSSSGSFISISGILTVSCDLPCIRALKVVLSRHKLNNRGHRRSCCDASTSSMCQERSFHDGWARHYLRFRASWDSEEHDPNLTSLPFSKSAYEYLSTMNTARLVRFQPMRFHGVRPQIRSLHASRALSRQKVSRPLGR